MSIFFMQKDCKSINLFLIVVILKSSNLKVSIHIKQVENSPKRFGMLGNFQQTLMSLKTYLKEKTKDFIINQG